MPKVKQKKVGQKTADYSPESARNFGASAHAHQKLIWDSTAKITAAISGFGGGKSHMGPPWLFREAAKWPGHSFLVCGPTRYMLRKAAIPKLEQYCKAVGLPWEYEAHSKVGYRAGYMEYALPGGGVIYFVSAERPGAMQGVHAKAFWMDETVDTDAYVYETLLSRIGTNNGRGLITSTPYDLGWFYTDVYLRWKNGDAKFQRDNIYCHQWRSIDNPIYSKEFFEERRATMPEWRFRMQYMGEFEQPMGLVYDCFTDEHFIEPFDLPRGTEITLGIDWGFSDPMAAIWVAKTPDDAIYLAKEFYRTGWMAYDNKPGERQLRGGSMATTLEMLDQIVAQCVELHMIPTVVYCDPSQPSYIIEAQRKFAAIGCHKVLPAINDIMPGIAKCYTTARTPGFKVFSDMVNFKDETTRYAWDLDKSTGELKKGIAMPVDNHNHAMDAWRYATMGSKDDKPNSFGVGSITDAGAWGRPSAAFQQEIEKLYKRAA